MTTARNRTGLIGRKLGMSSVFTPEGASCPITLIKLEDNYVAGNSKAETDGYNAVSLVCGEVSKEKATKNQLKLKTADGYKFFSKRKEFRIKTDDALEVGKKISINHYVKGQFVDVTAVSKGKGFAGAMKRHGFAGMEASHGVSISHRAHGSTGQCQDPGKVFKGKKMAGHMGDKQVTIQNLEILDIDSEIGVIAVYGSVPGAKNSYVYINDAVKIYLPEDAPYPTKYEGSEDLSAEVAVDESQEQDVSSSEEQKSE